MDPTAALAEIRALMFKYRERGLAIREADDLVNRVWDLDVWLMKGGFPPSQWFAKGVR